MRKDFPWEMTLWLRYAHVVMNRGVGGGVCVGAPSSVTGRLPRTGKLPAGLSCCVLALPMGCSLPSLHPLGSLRHIYCREISGLLCWPPLAPGLGEASVNRMVVRTTSIPPSLLSPFLRVWLSSQLPSSFLTHAHFSCENLTMVSFVLTCASGEDLRART